MSGYVKGGSSNTESQAGRMEQFLPLPLHFQGKLRKSGGERKKNKGKVEKASRKTIVIQRYRTPQHLKRVTYFMKWKHMIFLGGEQLPGFQRH